LHGVVFDILGTKAAVAMRLACAPDNWNGAGNMSAHRSSLSSPGESCSARYQLACTTARAVSCGSKQD
jgi:hypothetical protein